MGSLARPPVGRGLSSCHTLHRAAPSSLLQARHPPSLRSQHAQHRHASSQRRQRKLLNIAPAPSFGGPSLPTGATGRSRTAREPLPIGDHIVFNPPSSAPNVYHTPPKFLPQSDTRKKLFEEHQQQQQAGQIPPPPPSSSTSVPPPTTLPFPATSTSTPVIQPKANFPTRWPTTHPLPTPVRTPYEKKYNLGPSEIEEMRHLRLSDANKWTSGKLVERFQCSRMVVPMIVGTSNARWEKLRKENEEKERKLAMTRNGRMILKRQEQRRKRKEMWGLEV